MLNVLTPKWWSGDGKQYEGLTDGVDTYCCCTVPAWWVEVPELKYSGYFNKSDLTVVEEGGKEC